VSVVVTGAVGACTMRSSGWPRKRFLLTLLSPVLAPLLITFFPKTPNQPFPLQSARFVVCQMQDTEYSRTSNVYWINYFLFHAATNF
jgi:hypothetical protein